jgi:tetratricopeptide (TPR) repeat protein
MLRPIAFGLFWFLLALLPTSIVPLAEVLNDHRTFFPYIGLVISAAWCLGLLLHKYETRISQELIPRILFIAIPAFILLGHAYGTIQRTDVWSSGEKLWYDVTIKSPENGRGLMNYANSQMAKGNYAVAMEYYERAQVKNPGYSYLFINKGILKTQMNKPAEAEADYKTALSLDAFNPEGYYYYGKFLIANARYNEANEKVTQGLRVSPDHSGLKELKIQLDKIIASQGNALNAAIQTAKQDPTALNYLNLSIAYYQAKKYDECIIASQEALKLNPNFAEAYNNICSANNNLGNFDAAVVAGQKAIMLAPGLVVAKNNLNVALFRKMQTDSLINIARTHPNAANYIQLSLSYYNFGCYQKCVDAATEALKYDANSAVAYNNICSGYNMLAMWDKAIEAGEKGLKISPDDNLLKNNLQAARMGKAAEK